MKLKNLFLAVMTVVIAASGCQKIDSPVQDDRIKVEFTIADKPVLGDNGQTKAVKTAWANGDQVLFIFKNSGDTKWYGAGSAIKGFLTTYNSEGDSWSELSIDESQLTALGTGGVFIAIHHRGSFTTETLDETTTVNTETAWKLENYAGGEFMKCKGTYTVSDGVVKLSTVNMELDSRLFQISASAYLKNSSDARLIENNAIAKMVMKNSTLTVKNPDMSGVPHLNIVSMKADMLYILPDSDNVFYFDNSSGTTDAAAVINGNDASYCFAHTSSILYFPANLRFTINGTYSSTSLNTYLDLSSTGKSLAKGKAYRLPESGWVVPSL